MKKEFKDRTIFSEGTFTDYSGEIREYTLAAYTTETKMMDFTFENSYILDAYQVNIGIAVRNVGDKYNSSLAKTIAEGKARKKPIMTYGVDHKFLIKKSILTNILDEISDAFVEDPGKYIAGYDKSKARYFEQQAKKVAAAKEILKPGTPSIKNIVE